MKTMFNDSRIVSIAFALATTMVACIPPSLPAATQPTLLITTPSATVIPLKTSSIPIPTSSPEPGSRVIHLRDALPEGVCALPTIIIPTPAPTPQSLYDVDPSTGLHVTGKAVAINLETYRLLVMGKVNHPLNLSYDELRCMPKVEAKYALVCPGVFRDTATWAGTPLDYVLKLAGIQLGANTLELVGADGYNADIEIETALAANGFLAYEWEGETLPILHGFPVRAVFPGVEGNKWVKWLVKIEVY
jgi:hypothetical protein